MRRRTFTRDLLWTTAVFVILAAVVFLFIVGEFYLENFKSH